MLTSSDFYTLTNVLTLEAFGSFLFAQKEGIEEEIDFGIRRCYRKKNGFVIEKMRR